MDMTVIAAIKVDNKVYMGCDSMFLDVGSLQVTKRTQSKLIIKDEMVIGLTTNGCRIFQTIQYKLKVPSTSKVETKDLLEYFIKKFCSSLYKLLHAENMLLEDPDAKSGEPSLSPASCLIGIRGKLFHIGEDFDVAELDMPFFAVGGGGEYAIGALEASTALATDFKPDDHILHALKTSEKYTAGVKRPYQLVNTETLCILECY
jgi:ATP-dependent protease HslVU (ClpYQ) peptidase subunit